MVSFDHDDSLEFVTLCSISKVNVAEPPKLPIEADNEDSNPILVEIVSDLVSFIPVVILNDLVTGLLPCLYR